MTSRLVLLNGIPASGKSTLARQWCARHTQALPLCLDIDTIRSMIGGWQDARARAGRAARDIAIAAIGAHLRAGNDVLVPQYLRNSDFIDRLAEVGDESGAAFVETALIIGAADAQRRFRARALAAGDFDM